MKNKKLFYAVSLLLVFVYAGQRLSAQSSSYIALGDVNISSGTTMLIGDMTLSGSSSLDNNGTLGVTGNVEVNVATTAGTGAILLNGTSTQTISGSNALAVHDITFDNSSGFIVQTTINIEGLSDFTNGIVQVDATDSVSYLAGATTSAASDGSHVDGKVSKTGSADFTFPTGDNGMVNQIEITGITGTNSFSAQYFYQAPPDNSSLGPGLNGISTGEYWEFMRTAGTSTVDATFYYNDGAISGITDPSATVMAWYNTSTQWQNQGQTAYTGDATSGTITLNGIDEYGYYTFGDDNPLPIELISFDATVNTQNNVDLCWATETEINNDYFTIERSKNGENWTAIATEKGAGNSNSRIDYALEDTDPLPGVSYYRLKQTDYDGAFTYSDIRSVNLQKWNDLSIYPNPTTSSFFVKGLEHKSRATLYSSVGEKLRDLWINPDKSIDVSQLDAGVYFLNILELQQNLKIIIQ